MPEDRDEMFDEAVKLVASEGKASTGLLQRKLAVGYARAARILDELEQAGVVGPANGNKPRIFTGNMPPVPQPSAETALSIVDDEPFDTEKDEITLEREQIEKKILAQFSEENVKVIKRLAYYISKVGHTLEEACKLCRIEPLAFKAQMTAYPILSEFIQLKELEYKSSLMEVVSGRGRSNDKVAQWLLESKYPEEFNRKKSGGDDGGGGEDLIAAGIEFVRQTGDASPIVGRESGRAFVVRRAGSGDSNSSSPATNDIVKRVQDILN